MGRACWHFGAYPRQVCLSCNWPCATIRAMKRLFLSALACASVAVLAAATVAGQYNMTVNRDRLINAQNEPQNWLMMNGDYASTRYSKLTQINRDNVKNLRLVWALALGGMQDVGQNGPESESQSARRQRLPVHQRRLGHALQDRRPQSQQGRVRLGDRSRREAPGQPAAHARHRALGRSRHRESAGRPRDRGQPRHRRNRLGQDGRHDERVRQPGTIQRGADHRGRQGDRRERRGRRQDARLDRGARRANRERAVALVRRAEAGRSGQRDVEGHEQRVEDRRRRPLADRLLRSGDEAHHLGHGQSGADLRSAGASRRQPLHQLRRRA